MLVDLFNLVAQEITANGYVNNQTIVVEWHPAADGKYGSLVNGSWNGMVGEIVNNTADVIASYFAVDESRQQVLAFSTPYFASGWVVMVRSAAVERDLWIFVRPFQSRLWGSIFALCFLVFLLLYWVDRCSPFGFKNQFAADLTLRRQLNMGNVLMAVLLPLFGQSAIRPSSWSSRITYFGYIFLMAIAWTLYSSNLTAQFTVTQLGSDVSDVYDLMKQRTNWCVSRDSAVYLWFSGNPDPRFSSMLSFATVVDGDSSACVQMLRDGTVDAVITSKQLAEYEASLPPCQLTVVGDTFSNGFDAFAVSAANQTLQRAISRATMHLVQTGVVDNLYRSYVSNAPGACTASDYSLGSGKGLDVTAVTGVFVVAFMFIAAGLGALALEISTARLVRGTTRRGRRCLRCCGQHQETWGAAAAAHSRGLCKGADSDSEGEDGNGHELMELGAFGGASGGGADGGRGKRGSGATAALLMGGSDGAGLGPADKLTLARQASLRGGSSMSMRARVLSVTGGAADAADMAALQAASAGYSSSAAAHAAAHAGVYSGPAADAGSSGSGSGSANGYSRPSHLSRREDVWHASALAQAGVTPTVAREPSGLGRLGAVAEVPSQGSLRQLDEPPRAAFSLLA